MVVRLSRLNQALKLFGVLLAGFLLFMWYLEVYISLCAIHRDDVRLHLNALFGLAWLHDPLSSVRTSQR